MVYTIEILVDGGCRNNGYVNAYGAAAAISLPRWGNKYWVKSQKLYENYQTPPTSQRAEIEDMILGLEFALERVEAMDDPETHVDVTIKADSKYVIGAMQDWIHGWSRNGWINSRGAGVANADLFQETIPLWNRLDAVGDVTFEWISRDKNHLAHEWCERDIAETEGRSY